MENNKEKEDKVICPYCGKGFKRITANHLAKHGIEYNTYLKEYMPATYMENLLIKFFDDYYITFRSKYLLYPPNGNTYTINVNKPVEKVDNDTGEVITYTPQKLIKKQLQDHIRMKATIGIFFPTIGTKIIGLDLDIPNTDALNKVYTYLTEFIEPTSILTTSSGGKGYHVDIFLKDILDRDIVKRFYEMILKNTGLNKHELELRGASEQGYKLPFGMHFKKNAYCGAVTSTGENIDAAEMENLILSRTKTDIHNIINAVFHNNNSVDGEGNNVDIPAQVDILSTDEIIEFEEISTEVTPLSNYNNLHEDFIENLAMIYRNGFNGSGVRNEYTFKIALFLKTHMRFKRNVVLEEMLSWKDRCKGYTASDAEFESDIRRTVKKIFDENKNLTVAAREIKISKIEIKEILSIKCRTSQQTRALRLLYYMMFLHSKAYANEDGVFFMTLEQMQNMGACKTKRDLLNQIAKLVELGKVYKFPTKRESKTKYYPTEYKLVGLSDIVVKIGARTFDICHIDIKCSDCMDKATDFLITTRSERQQYRKGKCLNCPYNKR